MQAVPRAGALNARCLAAYPASPHLCFRLGIDNGAGVINATVVGGLYSLAVRPSGGGGGPSARARRRHLAAQTTLGLVHEGWFYFVANSHWPDFADFENPKGKQGVPEIRKLRLPSTESEQE